MIYMKEFSPSVKEIDKKIKEIIEDTMFNNNIDIELGQLYIIIKHTLNYINYKIKCDGKIRSLSTYFNKNHKSISNFIKTNTEYKLLKQDELLYITS